ncbi:MAG: dienelactone hydrolase family protein [Terracidiphilus sp.]
MANSRPSVTRREFMIGSVALANSLAAKANGISVASGDSGDDFRLNQQRRRQDLWSLLGDLPWDHKPAPPQLVRTEKHDGYTLQRWILDLNGIEPVPALLLIPDHRQNPAPGLQFIHWHAGQYDLGKEQLLKGVDVQPAYAPVCAEKGLVTLAIDSWCFGERKHDANGRRGEEDAFKEMLWRGRVLWGMMMFDEFRALDFLAGRPEVDSTRLGAFGMSMGSTKTWWLAALDPRVHLAIDVCCLTDFESLIQAHNLSGHGLFYFVPSLLKHFDTAQINALIVPRAHLSVNGRKDTLTPPAGVEKIRNELTPLYRTYGREEDLHIELFDCAHQELPEMRELILKWMDHYLLT